jgi:hypothetical protein
VESKSLLIIGGGVLLLVALVALAFQVRGATTPVVADRVAAAPAAEVPAEREARPLPRLPTPRRLGGGGDEPAEPEPFPVAPEAEPTPEEIDPQGAKSVRAGGALRSMAAKMPGTAPTDAELNARLDEANRVYDRGDYEGARDLALEVLRDHPDNARMMRIVVSTSCAMGDEAVAREYYAKLAAFDQRRMQRRCSRYGITFQ